MKQEAVDHKRGLNKKDKNQPRISAIFIDFDNWLDGILQNSGSVPGAQEIVAHVKKLYDSLVEGKNLNCNENASLFGQRRRLISCRVYINGRGRVHALDKEKKGTFYDLFFVRLMRLGFEVVDCQSISFQDVSHADVHMTIDIVQMLEQRNDQLDEVILVSNDTDFSPLISFLAKSQVYVTLVAWDAADNLKRLPDHYINQTEALKCMGGQADKHKALSSDIDMQERDPEEAQQKAVDLVRRLLRKSDTCIPIADLGVEMRNQLGSELIENTEWFGYEKLGRFIQDECGEDIWVVDYYVWLKGQRKPPVGIRDPDEVQREAIALIDNQLARYDAPISTEALRSSICDLLGSELIDDTAWFGYRTLSRFIRKKCNKDIRVESGYVWLEDTHKAPDMKGRDPEEAKQEAVALIQSRLEASDIYIDIGPLGAEIHKRLGSELIEDTKWFSHKKLGSFILNECGESIRVEGYYVWLEDTHKAPSKAKQEAVDLIQSRLEASDTYIDMAPLGAEIRNLLGSELIEDTKWFSHEKLSSFILSECDEGIRVEGHYVWLEYAHKAPSSDIEMKESEEAKQEAVALIQSRLEASDTYIDMASLGIEIRKRLGSDLIEDTKWFSHKKLGSFILNECGEGIRVEGNYVWLEDKHGAPPSESRESQEQSSAIDIPEEARKKIAAEINKALKEFDTYIHLNTLKNTLIKTKTLEAEIDKLIGSDLIDGTEWIRAEKLSDFIRHECGKYINDIQVEGYYVWLKGTHKAPQLS